MAITIVKPEDLKDYIGKDLGTTEWFKVDLPKKIIKHKKNQIG